MTTISGALEKLGIDKSLTGAVDAAASLGKAVDQFSNQQLGPSAASLMKGVLGTVLPPILRTDPTSKGVSFSPAKGEWEAGHYANDLITHQPKFKFLFKVFFKGFPGGDFYRYVHRCDKPRVQLNHTDVNYYNFRSKVLTSVSFSPLSMTFLDETGDSVNSFFKDYLKLVSQQASGGSGIEGGNKVGKKGSSSSIPYKKGYAAGESIIIQQIFANGIADNKFIFTNPRIESFDFDELSMEDTNGSLLTISFHYDSIECMTGNGKPEYTWGNIDIHGGGGTSNMPNAGADSAKMGNSRGPLGSIMAGKSPITLPKLPALGGLDIKIPTAISDLVTKGTELVASVKDKITSGISTLDRGIQDTFMSIASGANLKFGGSAPGSTLVSNGAAAAAAAGIAAGQAANGASAAAAAGIAAGQAAGARSPLSSYESGSRGGSFDDLI